MTSLPFTSGTGSAVDPLASEISWRAWRLIAADPSRVSAEVVQSLTVGFDCLVEAAWQPGRSVLFSQLEWAPNSDLDQEGELAVHLAVGMLGPAGSTDDEVEGISARVREVLRRHHVLAAVEVDPATVIGSCDPLRSEPDRHGHMVHVRQRTATIGDEVDIIEVVSRFSPTIEPWTAVASQLADLDRHVRVRATVLSTELSPADRMEIERDLARVQAMRARTADRPEMAFDADRAEATLLDLRASLASPVLAAEIAIWSDTPLAHTAVRSIAASFTSESDVLRRQGHVVVATNRLLLGGYQILTEPEGWPEAQHLGIPLRGGARSRQLGDLRDGEPFLFIDPHGGAADELIARADAEGIQVVVIDAADGATDQIQVLPVWEGTSRDVLDRATRRFSDAVASSMKAADWTGPRWFSTFEAMLELVALHEAELVDGVVWLNDADQLRPRLDHPELSAFARSTLANLSRSTGEGADVRGWVSSKLHPVVSGSARRIIARAGQGVDLAAAVAAGIPVIVNLASLSVTEGNLVGHLALAAILDGAFEQIDPDRPIVTCYLDEAHRFPASGMARAFAEGRKFAIALDIAIQGLGQLPAELADLATAAGTQLAFRATPDTAGRLGHLLGVAAADLLGQPDLHATVVVHGHPATSVVIEPLEPCPVARRRTPLRELPPPLSEGGPEGSASDRTTSASRGSFLDEYLARNRKAAVTADDPDAEVPDEAMALP